MHDWIDGTTSPERPHTTAHWPYCHREPKETFVTMFARNYNARNINIPMHSESMTPRGDKLGNIDFAVVAPTIQ